MKACTFLSLLFLSIAFCNGQSAEKAYLTPSNPLLQPWSGPYGGVPDFNAVKPDILRDAMLEGMAITLKNYDNIANNPAAPTFDNTMIPLEAATETFSRARVLYDLWSANLSTPDFRIIQDELDPKLAEFGSKYIQNEKLFARVKTIYQNSQKKPLPDHQQRLVKLTYLDFAMRGADLDANRKKRYSEIEVELSKLQNQFRKNLLADEQGYVTFFSVAEAKGLPDSYLKSAAKAAADRGQPEMFAVTNVSASSIPVLTSADNRALREKVWRNYYSRCDHGDENDNNQIISDILRLRQERVRLLGYSNYAQWRLQDRMAGTPERAMQMMNTVWAASTKRVGEEVADMQVIADKDHVVIEPWDYWYYAEKVRKAKYDLDSEEVKQYLQLDKIIEAMFFVAGEVFNFEFKFVQREKVPIFHEDVRVWEVTNKTTGAHIGLWYLDPYARQGKRPGAWATTYRVNSNIGGQKNTVLCSNNSNFVKAAPGQPLLMTWSEANTFFHEFGHALHMLSSNVPYRSLNLGGVRDYTEFQSQLLERWLMTDQVTTNYFKHHSTGQAMPKELIEKLKKAATFNQGFRTTSYLSSAFMDMFYHTSDLSNIDPKKFEKEKLESISMPRQVTMTHRTAHFYHIFNSEGYAAGYYGYMWADVLASDATAAFSTAPGGFYDKDVISKMKKYLFEPRNAIDPAEAYRLFRGADPDIKFLLKERGF